MPGSACSAITFVQIAFGQEVASRKALPARTPIGTWINNTSLTITYEMFQLTLRSLRKSYFLTVLLIAARNEASGTTGSNTYDSCLWSW